jgi:nucleotide-binding universal stress UspA family protein
MKRLILGVDGSGPSIEATKVTGRLAADLGAELLVGYVHQAPPLSWSPMQADPGDVEAGWQMIDDQIRARAAEVLDQLGVKWTFQVRTGEPAAELEVAAAGEKADLIVVGSRGHAVKERLLLGLVPIRLLHYANRPVMVVRFPQAAPSGRSSP